MRIPVYVTVVILMFITPSSWSQEQQAHQYSIGIVPMLTTSRAGTLWLPLLAYIRTKTGVELHFETAKDISTYELRLAAGAYDFAYMNPYDYVTFSKHYKMLAHDNRKLQGILVVRDDSKFHRVDDLKGETIAFPAPISFAATLLVQAELRKLGIPYHPEYVGSHDSVYEAVSMGLYAAGGGIQQTYINRPASSLKNLRILMTTQEYMPHVFTVHTRVPTEDVRKVKAALLAMHQTKEGHEFMEAIGLHQLVTGDDKEYNDVRALKVDLLRHMGRSP